jgi:hypothetical protein
MSTRTRELVNLNGAHMIEVMLMNPPDGLTTEQWYEKIRNRVLVEVLNPAIKTYLESLQLKERIQEIKKLEVLEGTLIEYFPLNLKELLADTLDEFTELSDGQKMYLLSMFMTAAHNSSMGYCQPILRARAQEIIFEEHNAKKSSIITLN